MYSNYNGKQGLLWLVDFLMQAIPTAWTILQSRHYQCPSNSTFSFPANIYLFKANNGPTRTTYTICSILIKTPEQLQCMYVCMYVCIYVCMYVFTVGQKLSSIYVNNT